MLGDRLAGDVEARGDLAGRALVIDQQREQLAPARLCEDLKDVTTHGCASIHLRKPWLAIEDSGILQS